MPWHALGILPPVDFDSRASERNSLSYHFSSSWGRSGLLVLQEQAEGNGRSGEGRRVLESLLRARGDPTYPLDIYDEGDILGFFIANPRDRREINLVIPKRQFTELLTDARRAVMPDSAKIYCLTDNPLPQDDPHSPPVRVVTDFVFSNTMIYRRSSSR